MKVTFRLARFLPLVSFACLSAVSLEAAVPDVSRIFLGSWPSVDRTGRTFAFEWNDRIWLAATTGGVARCVTPGSAKCAYPRLSDDARRVAFTSNRDGNANYVYVADLVTGEVRPLSRHSERTPPMAWTADGSNLVVVAVRDDSGDNDGERAGLLSATRGGDVRLFFDAEAHDAMLSPDGTRLLFRRHGETPYRKRVHSRESAQAGEIWLYDLAAKTFAPVVTGRFDARDPFWAPDGKGFYFLYAPDGIKNVYYRSLEKPDMPLYQLTHFTDDSVFRFSVSADGRTAVLRQAFDFWRLDLTTPDARPVAIPLVPEPGYVARPPTRRRWYSGVWNNDTKGDVAFAADGTNIAFTAGGDLYAMDYDTREPKLVHGGSLTHERECVFSPDGGTLYYVSDRGDGTDLWKAARADPAKPWWKNAAFVRTKLASDDEIRRNFTISPDGGKLAWTDPMGRLHFADTNGVLIARGPQTVSPAAYGWSPDGKYVVASLQLRNVQNDIYIVSAEKDDTAWQLTCNYLWDGSPVWSPDGAVIAWTSERPDVASGELLSYVYLDEALEERETLHKDEKERPQADEKRPVPFERLIDRVRVTKIRARGPFFADDGRTLAFEQDGVTKSVQLPNEMTPKKAFGRTGDCRRWTKKKKGEGKLLWLCGNLPACGEKTLGFNVYQTTVVADYQELAFRTAWARFRDTYYDANMHGVDWPAVREKYLPYARSATSVTVFGRVINMMQGELDSSHLSFRSTNNSRKEWEPSADAHSWAEETRHLGVRFDPAHRGPGWKVRDVIPDSPADRREYALAPGTLVTNVNGVAVSSDTPLTDVLNGPKDLKATLVADGREVRLETISYGRARELLKAAELKATRRRVHDLSGGRFGYLNIAAMDRDSLERFRHEVYAEGFGRDGLVIDVRGNHGGTTADRMMFSLFANLNSQWNARGQNLEYYLGYSQWPVWYKPVVVLCGEDTGSNAEIFSHAIQQLGRGKLVGRETCGAVIATRHDDLLDVGSINRPHLGVFLLDGRDMEYNGAKPEFEVENLPCDDVAGVDRQLEKAVDVLKDEVARWKAAHPPVTPSFAK